METAFLKKFSEEMCISLTFKKCSEVSPVKVTPTPPSPGFQLHDPFTMGQMSFCVCLSDGLKVLLFFVSFK